jgi:hypothetical protein
MKPIRTQQDKAQALSDIERLRELAKDKGYKFGTAYDDAKERLTAKEDAEDRG